MKKFIISLVIMIVISVSPLFAHVIYGQCIQGDSYDETFYAELEPKISRLKTVEGKRIVFIGGSSLAFGIRSDEIEKATGYPVVNFGLYAQLGTKVMMDLAINYIHEGDIVILSPELNSQTYSTYMNYEMILRCLESCPSSYFDLPLIEQEKMFYYYFDYIYEKNKVGHVDNNIKPYSKDSFNEYGDIKNEVTTQNILVNLYDDSQMINPSNDLLFDDFIDYVNKYYKKVIRKKASMYFSFSPTNSLSLIEDEINQFERALDERLDVKILGSIKDFTYNPLYFYDTNYHLNYTGSLLHSSVISEMIKKELNITLDYQISIGELPLPQYNISSNDTYGYYKISKTDDGYFISGIDDAYKAEIRQLSIPEYINDEPVIGILTNCFENMPLLSRISLPSSIVNISNSPFTNCPNLKEIIIHADNPPVVGTGFLDGVSRECLIFVNRSALNNYTTGYLWASYVTRILPVEVLM